MKLSRFRLLGLTVAAALIGSAAAHGDTLLRGVSSPGIAASQGADQTLPVPLALLAIGFLLYLLGRGLFARSTRRRMAGSSSTEHKAPRLHP